MITKTLKASIVLIAVASFSFAGAQEKAKAKEDKSAKMFKHLDVNGDNTITLEEYKAKTMKDPSKEELTEKRFVSMDTDKNGSIDRAEFKVAFEKPRALQPQKIKATKG